MCVVLVMQMVLPDTREPLLRGLAGQAIFVVLLLPAAMRWLQRHFQPWSQVNVVQQLVVVAGAMVGALVMVVLVPLPTVPALDQALKTTPFLNAPLLDLLAMSQTVVEGLQRMALAEASTFGEWPKLAASFLYFFLWLPPSLASAGVFVALGVRWSEMRRAFASPQPLDYPGPVAWGAVVAVLLAGTIFWGLHHYLWMPLNNFVAQKQIPQKTRETIKVVKLGERYFSASAISQVLATRPSVSGFIETARNNMCENADKAFEGAQVQSLKYVDYYYSMPAAVMRTGLAFSDRPDDAMNQDIQRRVFDSSFQKLMTTGAATVRQAESMAKAIDQEWLKGAQKFLAEHEVHPSNDISLNVIAEAHDLSNLTRAPDVLMDPRWQGATAVASALLVQGGVEAVAGKASRSIGGAPAIKGFASRLVPKAQLGGKTTRIVEAAAKGATRAATGVIGATAGTAVGVLVTKGLLEADEAVNRKEFETQIRGKVDDARTDFMQKAMCKS